ncbi:MAG: TRAP transporter substrate-binding protein DctP, partial [Oscillospiraceae bacterium]
QELGDEYEVIEQLEIGGVDFTRVSSNSLTDISSDFAALQLPFIFDSEEHMWRVLDGKIGEKLFRGLDDAGIIGLSWFSSGKRCFYSSKRIDNIDDLAGMKIRTQNSEVMTAIVKALGAEPISVYYSDVYGAFSVGTIDAAENNMPSYYKMRHYEKANYFLTDGHSMMPDVFIASSTLKEELSSDDFAIITNCAKDAAIYERSLWETAEQTSALKLKESGVVFRHLTVAEHIALKQKLQPVVD